jgi:DNA-binding transcriptional LysR family regulator
LKGRDVYDWAEFRHFKYLLAILERRGFRAAAEQLHTSQPNLTVQARQFQENAGVRLFRRSKAGHIRPTETGTAFIVLSRYLLEVRDEVIDALGAIERGEIESLTCASRTMYLDSTASLERHLNSNSAARKEWERTHKLKDDPRVTRIGSFYARQA